MASALNFGSLEEVGVNSTHHEIRVPAGSQPLFIQNVQLIDVRIQPFNGRKVVSDTDGGEILNLFEVCQWWMPSLLPAWRIAGQCWAIQEQVVVLDELLQR